MPKPYTIDLRERVIEYSNTGSTGQVIADVLKVSKSFVSRLLKRYRETKTIEPKKPVSTRPFKLNYNEVKKYIDKNPDKTLKEIGKEFNTSHVAIFYILKKIGYSYKKRDFYTKKEMKD